MEKLLVSTINPGLSPYQFQSLKLACIGLNISRHSLESATTFTDLYQQIEHLLPQHAPSLAYQMLCKVKYPSSKLEDLHSYIKTEASMKDYPTMDLILTVAVILGDMKNECYREFKKRAHSTFLTGYHPSRITSCGVLIELLIDADFMTTPTNVKYLFHWLDECCKNQNNLHVHLREYCNRHEIREEVITCNVESCINVQQETGNHFEVERSITISITERIIIKDKVKSLITRYICAKQFFALLLVLMLPLFFLLLSSFLFYFFHDQQLLHKFANSDNKMPLFGRVGANSLVEVFPDTCLNPFWVREMKMNVTCCKNRDDMSIVLQLYKTSRCDSDPHTITHNLVERKRANNVFRGIGYSANYISYDTPIYTAAPSVLVYNFNVSFDATSNYVSCAFKLCIFDDYASYHKTRNSNAPPVSNYYNCSGCLNGSNDHIVFPLNESGFYYGAFYFEIGAHVNYSISGTITKYSTNGMSYIEECSIDRSQTFCSIDVLKKFTGFEIFVNSSVNQEVNVTLTFVPDEWNLVSIIGVIGMTFFGLTCIGIIACIICCSAFKYRKYNEDYVKIK